MYFWSRFPFVRITLALLGGILAARYWEGLGWMAGILLGVLLLAYVLIVKLAPLAAFRTWSPLLGLLGLASIFLLGYLRWLTREVRHDPEHLTHWSASIAAYEAIALEDIHAQRSSGVVAVRRARVQGTWQPVKGKVRISCPQDPVPQVRYGDILLIHGRPRAAPAVRNPEAFDYAAFLGLAQVYHQHFVAGEEIVVMGHQPPSRIQALSFQALRYCQALLSQHIHAPEAQAVVLALVLGQKDALTPAVRAAYVGTGTMHVLAVSGLHVGVIYWLLSLLLGLLPPLSYARCIASVIVLGSLWFYAFVTGLSPSVLRATLMFTLVALASMLGRQSNIYNTLAASAFLLLLWHPGWLFAVGFQLSYLAVLGIVYLQPRIYSAWSFQNSALKKLWFLASVSLAAQVVTAPITLYYFHQFPSYFILANWVVVPAALLILYLGVGVLMTSCWPALSVLVAWVLEHLVLSVNALVRSIQALPHSVIDNVALSTFTVLLLYSLLLLWLLFWRTRRLRYGVAASVLILLLSLRAIQTCLVQQSQRQVIFYSVGRHQVVAFMQGCQSTLCTDARFKDFPHKHCFHVQPSHIALGITSLVRYTFEEAAQQPGFPLQTWQGLKVAVWDGKQFIFVSSNSLSCLRFASRVPTDFLILENNAVTALQPLLDRFDFATLVIGASNDRALAQRLQAAATQRGLHSHSLREQGALSVSW